MEELHVDFVVASNVEIDTTDPSGHSDGFAQGIGSPCVGPSDLGSEVNEMGPTTFVEELDVASNVMVENEDEITITSDVLTNECNTSSMYLLNSDGSSSDLPFINLNLV